MIMSLVLNWYRKLGYRKDPFVDKPTKKIIGLESLKNKINLFLLRNEQLAIIRGDDGMGKSSFVMWMDKELQFKRKVHDINLRIITSREKLETLLDSITRPFYKSLLKDERTKEERLQDIYSILQKKTHLLVIEDARLLNNAQITLLNQMLEKSKLQIILLDTPDAIRKNPLNVSPAISVTIPKYKDEELEKILQERIEAAGSVGIFPFDKKTFHHLTGKSSSNPRELLHLARDKAMELSLKNLELPQKEKSQKQEKTEKKQTEKEDKKEDAINTSKGFNLFGKIKFEFSDKAEDNQENTKEDIEEKTEEVPKPKKEKPKKEKSTEEVDETIDVDLLKEIVEGKEWEK